MNSPHQDVNHVRQSMFSQGTRSIEGIPPTQAASEQDVKRAAFQAGHRDGIHVRMVGYRPGLPGLPEASKAYNELIKCGCRSRCRRHLQVQQGKSALHGNVYVYLQWQLLSRVKKG